MVVVAEDAEDVLVELAIGDFGEPGSIQAALDGVDGVFLACSNQPQQVEYENRVIDAAEEAGVRRIVKLSALGAEIGSPVAFWDWHARIEDHLRASDVPSVVLRPTFSMANLLASAEAVQYTGKLFAPAGEAGISMIHPQDVAAVASVALVEDRHDGKTYTLTGPEAITFGQVAGYLWGALGREIEYLNVPDEAALQSMAEQGLPEFVAGQIVTVFGFLRSGVQERTTSTVRTLTGHDPRPFALFASEHARLFAPPRSNGKIARKRRSGRVRLSCGDSANRTKGAGLSGSQRLSSLPRLWGYSALDPPGFLPMLTISGVTPVAGPSPSSWSLYW